MKGSAEEQCRDDELEHAMWHQREEAARRHRYTAREIYGLIRQLDLEQALRMA